MNEQILEDAKLSGFRIDNEGESFIYYNEQWIDVTKELTKFAELTKARAIEAWNRQNSEPIYEIHLGLIGWTDVNPDTYANAVLVVNKKRIVYLAPPQPQTVRDALEMAANICDDADKSTHPADIADAIRALIDQPQPPAAQELLDYLNRIESEIKSIHNSGDVGGNLENIIALIESKPAKG